MNFKKWVKSIQTAGCNDTRTVITTVNSDENRVLKELKSEFIKSLAPMLNFFSRERDMIHIRLWFYTVIFPELKSRIFFWKIILMGISFVWFIVIISSMFRPNIQ